MPSDHVRYDSLPDALPSQRPGLVWQPNAKALRNHPRVLTAVLAGAALIASIALIALIAFVAALQPQHHGPQQLRGSTGVKLASEQATIRPASGAGTIPAAAGIVAAVRLTDAVSGQPTTTDATPPVSQQFDTSEQDDEDWAQQQDEEEQDEQNEEQAQQALQQAEQQALEDEQQAQLDEQQAGQ